jgi:dUTP pyrophosphatase
MANSHAFLLIKTDHKEFYENHSYYNDGDSGLDIFFPENITVPAKSSMIIDLGIKCNMRKSSLLIKDYNPCDDLSYFVIPRSSISKTPLRMSNSIGLIDAGYRESIKVAVDNISDSDYHIKKGDRLFQIILPNLQRFTLLLVSALPSTARGSGFGSTNK